MNYVMDRNAVLVNRFRVINRT